MTEEDKISAHVDIDCFPRKLLKNKNTLTLNKTYILACYMQHLKFFNDFLKSSVLLKRRATNFPK